MLIMLELYYLQHYMDGKGALKLVCQVDVVVRQLEVVWIPALNCEQTAIYDLGKDVRESIKVTYSSVSETPSALWDMWTDARKVAVCPDASNSKLCNLLH
jgi:hypothetical protein